MALIKVQPRSFEQSFNNLMDDLFFPPSSLFRSAQAGKAAAFSLPVNVVKHDNGYELQLVAPGFAKEDFKVDLEQGLLTVSAQQPAPEAGEQVKSVRREFQAQAFKRSFHLDETIDAAQITGRYNNGILYVHLPLKPVAQEPVKQISIQ